ncbi:prepilin-type N-terminal cleavage/methylation domain-containing protein [Elusimicrobium posterum]|uniref:type IV pilin protein n=1 Tax=Elusimicrobium posterum TaxID=3116653 RepID=UPI003C70BCCE
MKKGFTLIELLVVVLIIGILAAIALPQYTKSVEKSRSTEIVLTTKNIHDSLQRAILAGGCEDANISDILDIDLTGGSWNGADELPRTYTSKNFEYKISCRDIESVRLKGDTYYSLYVNLTANPNTFECFTQETTMGRYICKSLTNYTYIDSAL